MSLNKAFVWVACGYKYVGEARLSAKGVQYYMPDIPRVLVTDEPIKKLPFTRVVQYPEVEGPWYLRNVAFYNKALELNYERMIFFDSDIVVLAPIYDVFALLERFDVVAAHAPARRTSPSSMTIPEAFPEFNIGVFGVHNIPRVRKLFASWLWLYEHNYQYYGENDQGVLREAVWRDERVQVYVLPPEYNCRFHFGTWVKGEIKILHGRHHDLAFVEAAVNEEAGTMRAWRPKELL